MNFILIVFTLFLFVAYADKSEDSSMITGDEQTSDYSDSERDMISLLFKGIRKALTHMNNDIPFLIKLADGNQMKLVNTSNEDIEDTLDDTDIGRKNSRSLKEALQRKMNANHSLIMKKELLHLAKDLSMLTISNFNRTNITASNLECIACNNLETLDCNAPLQKDLPSIVCHNSKEICYSTHTPFGIVDRGCINIIKHMNIYVCKCNLCNYIPISEMPVVFNKKLRWIEDVFEISHRRHLQSTIFKDMSCLKCEVNVTKEVNDMLDDAHCLEGNINKLPTEVCEEDQVCAVKAIRDQGYIWRGCVSKPLYNYWWTFCDTNLCNHDSLATIYDVTLAV